MKFHTVVIDANFLIRDYKLNGNALQKLVRTRDFYALTICIPEVVRDECIGNFCKEIESINKDLSTLTDRLNRLGLKDAINKRTATNKVEDSPLKYKQRLSEFIKNNNITLLPYPDISHKEIVERMYLRKKPFTDAVVREKGYKDFLIIKSIKKHTSQDFEGNTLLLTENVADFACAKQLHNKDKDLLPLDDQYELPNVYVAKSPAILFSALSGNIGNTCSDDIIATFKDRLLHTIRRRFSDVDAELLFDVFSSMLDVNILQESLKASISECQVQIDEDTEIMEAKGIIKISFQCSFLIDNYDIQLKIVDDDFVFIGQVRDRLFSERLSSRGEWTESFSNVSFDKEFLFEYIDFDYSLNNENTARELDPLYLSIFRL